jgi:hypothetical protein
MCVLRVLCSVFMLCAPALCPVLCAVCAVLCTLCRHSLLQARNLCSMLPACALCSAADCACARGVCIAPCVCSGPGSRCLCSQDAVPALCVRCPRPGCSCARLHLCFVLQAWCLVLCAVWLCWQLWCVRLHLCSMAPGSVLQDVCSRVPGVSGVCAVAAPGQVVVSRLQACVLCSEVAKRKRTTH